MMGEYRLEIRPSGNMPAGFPPLSCRGSKGLAAREQGCSQGRFKGAKFHPQLTSHFKNHCPPLSHRECSMELTEGVLTMIKGGSNDTNLQLDEVTSNKMFFCSPHLAA
jgi:hypothetical protein